MPASTEHEHDEHEHDVVATPAPLASTEAVLWMIERDPALRSKIVPVVPLGGNLSLGIAVLSYAGRLVLGLHADADACPDVDLVARGIERAFIELQPPVRRRATARHRSA